MIKKTDFWRAALATLAALGTIVGTAGGGGGGCGGTTTGTTGGSSATTGTGSSGTTSGTGSGTTTSSSGSAIYTGTVILSDIASGGAGTHALIGSFLTTTAEAGACAGGTPMGSCCYEPPPQTSGSSGSIPTQYSAGSLTVADNGATIATIAFASGYAGSSAATPGLTWAAGDSLSVSAPGATVDSFSGTIHAPAAIAGLTPTISEASPIAIPLASDWTVAWTPDPNDSTPNYFCPDTSGCVGEMMIVALTETGGGGEISCSVPDSAATVTFPSALLANFASGRTANIAVDRSAGHSVTDANTAVALLIGVEVGGTATLQ